MSDQPAAPPTQSTWRFPATFWNANAAELCERAAYYGMFISLVRYLNQDIGFTDIETGYITAAFASILYFLPTFMGIMADKIGFKTALLMAFALLTGGYGLLGAFQLKATALAALALIMFGGAIIKPVISGTIAKTSDEHNRARAMSIFYMVVNIGAFSGKALAAPLNEHLGLQYINFYAAGMSLLALLIVAAFYRDVDSEGKGKTVGDALNGLLKVCMNFRFVALILIIGGFWAIQGQLYAAMPTYVERLLGKGYKPEWLANINPLVVVILAVPITHLFRHLRPVSAIGIGLLIIPFTALVIAIEPIVHEYTGDEVNLLGWVTHPMIVLLIIGIGLQGLAECFLSPRFLEYASKQAPPGEVGLYLGFQHLTTFFAWLFGFILSGYLLAAFVPDPQTLDASARHEWRTAIERNYQFTLPAEFQSELRAHEGGLASPELALEFAQQGLTLAPTGTLTAPEPLNELASDPEYIWKFAVPADHPAAVALGDDAEQHERDDGTIVIYTIKEAQLKTEGATAEASAAAVGGQRPRELVVYSSAQRAVEGEIKLPEQYVHAHYLWYAFAGVGFLAFFALVVFKFVTDAADKRDGGTPAE